LASFSQALEKGIEVSGYGVFSVFQKGDKIVGPGDLGSSRAFLR